MRYPVREIYTSTSWLEYGEIISKERDSFFVLTPSGKFLAEKALSCIIEPEKGDKVLISTDVSGDVYILSVLKRRANKRENNIVLTGDINIISQDGSVKLKAQRDVSIASHESLKFTSKNMQMHAQNSKVEVNKLSFVGKVFYAQIKTIRMVCASVEQIVGRLTQKLQDCFKFVKGQNEVQSGSSRYLVEDMLTVQSKNAIHQAEEVITINGEQVHLG